MDYNEAKKTLEDLGINPKEVAKQGQEIVSEIMEKTKVINQNNYMYHVSNTIVCMKCGKNRTLSNGVIQPLCECGTSGC
jgi:hypothetical protein